MIKAKIEKVSISSITENAANPRTINKHKFQKLVNSVKQFPEMFPEGFPAAKQPAKQSGSQPSSHAACPADRQTAQP